MEGEITTLKLFNELEALRVKTKVTIDTAAFLMGVTPLTYKNWKNHGAVPSALHEPAFREAIKYCKKLEAKQCKKSS